MNNSIKLIMARGALGLLRILVAGLALTSPAQSHDPVGGAHDYTVHGRAGAASGETTITFYTEMDQVNARMHEAMKVAPTGDPDRDFARMMIPHHQGAIDMARTLLKYARDERLKRLAQSIIVEQGQEIAYMRTLLGAPGDEPSSTHHP